MTSLDYSTVLHATYDVFMISLILVAST